MEEEVTPEFVKQKVASGRQYSLLIYTPGTNRSQSEAEAGRIQLEHLTYLFKLKQQKKILLVGPVLQSDKMAGMCIFDTTDKEEVEGYAQQDPAVHAGRLNYEIYTWFGIPGDKI